MEALRISAAVLLVPNLILVLNGGTFSGLFRGWANVELLAIAAVYLLSPNRVLLLCLGAEALLDLVEPVAHTYYFSAADGLDALRYLNLLPFWRSIGYGTGLIAYLSLFIAVMSALLRTRRSGSRVYAAALFLGALLLFSIDFGSGRYQALGADVRSAQHKVVRTPALSLGYRALCPLLYNKDGAPYPVASASHRILDRDLSALLAQRRNVVLVLVESWGQPVDRTADPTMAAAYSSLQVLDRYRIETGLVPFNGPTIYGEARELCGTSLPSGISKTTAADLKACLPNVFAAHGYATIGVHGFYARMYDRRNWYPRVGFQGALFKEDFDRLGAKSCDGGLVGTCDTEVANWIANRLAESSPAHPLFLHWATLNSHLPLTDDVTPAEQRSCKSAGTMFDDPVLCKWRMLVERVHECVTRIALTKGLPPTTFVIFGDHAPPFSSSRRRFAFSQTQVPFIALTPR